MGDDRSAYQPFALPGARPHYGPDKLVAVEEIALDLVPDLERESLDGCCTTTVRAFDEPVTHLSLDAVDLDVSGVEHVEPGAPPRGAGFVVRDGKLDVTFDPPIAPGESATFAVTYRVERPRYGLFFVRPSASHPEKSRTRGRKAKTSSPAIGSHASIIRTRNSAAARRLPCRKERSHSATVRSWSVQNATAKPSSGTGKTCRTARIS